MYRSVVDLGIEPDVHFRSETTFLNYSEDLTRILDSWGEIDWIIWAGAYMPATSTMASAIVRRFSLLPFFLITYSP